MGEISVLGPLMGFCIHNM